MQEMIKLGEVEEFAGDCEIICVVKVTRQVRWVVPAICYCHETLAERSFKAIELVERAS